MHQQLPSVGRWVTARNVVTPGDVCAALITRVHGPECVNLSIFPDGHTQQVCKTSVRLFDDAATADAYLSQLPGHTPLLAHWPART